MGFTNRASLNDFFTEALVHSIKKKYATNYSVNLTNFMLNEFPYMLGLSVFRPSYRGCPEPGQFEWAASNYNSIGTIIAGRPPLLNFPKPHMEEERGLTRKRNFVVNIP